MAPVELWRVEELKFWTKKLEQANRWYGVFDQKIREGNYDNEKDRKETNERRDQRHEEMETALTKINEILPIINQQYKNSTE